jgi:hypothetical protein
MPKSASTFLTDAIAALPGMRRVSLTHAHGEREQVLDFPRLCQHDLNAYVAQQHLRYSQDAAAFLDEFGITPVVLTRNIFDAVASLRDHIRKESHAFPFASLSPEHAALPDADLEEMIADLVVPWYIGFFVGWLPVDCLHFNYDEVREAAPDVIELICKAARINVTTSDILHATQCARSEGTRFNRGISGRGADISANAREIIMSYARHYPDVDFGEIGIPPQP